MRHRAWMFCLAALLLIGTVGLFSGAVKVAAEGETPHLRSARYRVDVIRVDLPSDREATPLTSADLGAGAANAILPRSGGTEVLAVPYPHRVLEALSARGTVEVLFHGEAECLPGARCQIEYGERFPVESLEIRGESAYITTKFEKVGVKLTLTNRARGEFDPPQHEYQVEFSTIAARSAGGQPIIFEASSAGLLNLPDGYTSVLSFFDRVPGEVLATGGEKGSQADATMQFFVLITRLDLK